MAALEKLVLLLDGGLGTTLEDTYQVQFSDTTPLWSGHLLISSPETLLKAQTAFARAGADILLTATYQASLAGFSRTLAIDKTKVGYSTEESQDYMRSA